MYREQKFLIIKCSSYGNDAFSSNVYFPSYCYPLSFGCAGIEHLFYCFSWNLFLRYDLRQQPPEDCIHIMYNCTSPNYRPNFAQRHTHAVWANFGSEAREGLLPFACHFSFSYRIKMVHGIVVYFRNRNKYYYHL